MSVKLNNRKSLETLYLYMDDTHYFRLHSRDRRESPNFVIHCFALNSVFDYANKPVQIKIKIGAKSLTAHVMKLKINLLLLCLLVPSLMVYL